MALLGAEQVGYPDPWAVAGEPLGNDGATAARTDDMPADRVVLEHPFPLVAAVDARAGFVGSNEPAGAQPLQNGGDAVVEARLDAREQIGRGIG